MRRGQSGNLPRRIRVERVTGTLVSGPATREARANRDPQCEAVGEPSRRRFTPRTGEDRSSGRAGMDGVVSSTQALLAAPCEVRRRPHVMAQR